MEFSLPAVLIVGGAIFSTYIPALHSMQNPVPFLFAFTIALGALALGYIFVSAAIFFLLFITAVVTMVK
jgi:hypothetical protein